MDTESFSIEPTYDAPHEVRRRVRAFLSERAAERFGDDAELLTTELVANVVLHAHSPVLVELEWEPVDEALRVEVSDGSSILPAVTDLAGADGGFGLRIVAALARDWGVRHLPAGKAVWFVLQGDR